MEGDMETQAVSEINLEGFDELLGKSKKIVVLEFYTTTCPICKAMAPIFSQVANELSSTAVFAKVNANQNPELAARFGVMGVPAFKLFCNGKEIGGIVGMTNATALGNTVKDFIRHGQGCKSTALSYEMDGYG
jgi:thioredoxin 1